MSSVGLPHASEAAPRPDASLLVWGMVLAAAYYATGLAGLASPQIGNQVSLIWAPAGLAFAALVRLGPRLWPAVVLGALAVALSTGLPLWTATLLALGNAAGPALAAEGLLRHGLHPQLDRRQDLWLFAVSAAAATLLSATNGACWLVMSGTLPWKAAPLAWAYWWLGDLMGVIVVGVPLLTATRVTVRRALAGRHWLPGTLLAGGAVLGGWLAFRGAAGSISPLLFLPYLLLGWLAMRSGVFAASATVLLLAVLSVAATLAGHGPFGDASPTSALAMLAGYLATLSAMPLLVTALAGELGATEQRWQLALAASHLGVADWDLRRGEIQFSPRWCALLGLPLQQAQVPADAFWSRLHPQDAGKLEAALATLRSPAQDQARLDCRLRCEESDWRWFELNALVADRAANGEPMRIVATARDVTADREASERQQVADSLFRQLHEGLLVTDAQHRVIETNPTFCEITGLERNELLGRVPALLGGEADGNAVTATAVEMRRRLADDGMWRGETVHRRPDGSFSTLQLTVSAVRSHDGEVRSHVVAVSDVTQSRQQQERLARQAHFDELTRLPNRTRLGQLLQDALDTSQREGSLLTVCHLDIDHFKEVNERHGHEVGDRLLARLAERIESSLRSWAGGDDVAARVGGDEFALLLRTATLRECHHAVERVLQQIAQPCDLGLPSGPITVTATIGATVFPHDRAGGEALLRHADQAMYGAKQAGRNGYLFFDAEQDRRTKDRFVALGRVQEALDASEFSLHYQPKVDMKTGRALGAEALLRWNHPEHGLVPPGQFLPLIEHTGLGVALGRWVLAEGIARLAAWLDDGLDITVSINVSARHLQEPSFVDELAGLLGRHGPEAPRHLVLEVLETAALADIDYTCELMQRCRALGIRFALDDFGTGYSTFTYLKRLPLDLLKIDRSFVHQMLDNHQDLAIVEGVIALSRTFGCDVVAEGVETPAQAARLIALGCNVGQGNGIAAAMPAEQLPGWVGAFRGMPTASA
ncbi:GGDEF domain-containing phosphodiesterase [uncultured Piscinibacter sp.]|uniref:bifunctional diguanylate cyclase/phosphodiesterase n=1 Tax=uncultured Piscinibacter sp. TaxID=1131835 RepID=UPI002620EEE4|nr:GGDEF domain-containing phosphodiesterase [uncultured Piscinibacter sp.]